MSSNHVRAWTSNLIESPSNSPEANIQLTTRGVLDLIKSTSNRTTSYDEKSCPKPQTRSISHLTYPPNLDSPRPRNHVTPDKSLSQASFYKLLFTSFVFTSFALLRGQPSIWICASLISNPGTWKCTVGQKWRHFHELHVSLFIRSAVMRAFSREEVGKKGQGKYERGK